MNMGYDIWNHSDLIPLAWHLVHKLKPLFRPSPLENKTMNEELLTTYQRLRHEEKLSGKLGEDVMEYLKTNEEACVDYKLSKAQVLQYFHNLFDGEPKSFYGDIGCSCVQQLCSTKSLLAQKL